MKKFFLFKMKLDNDTFLKTKFCFKIFSNTDEHHINKSDKKN